ncbi:hypothetical protein [Chenggangzhangella methanolivorans]|uniref:hypothetical protein n=1 Tax=Chenggangzhangella methanolivorans TaxID=1437009 RepID=UPI0021BD8357|nr:hypothetical protein [Chenggangzhangella methanolivorans]
MRIGLDLGDGPVTIRSKAVVVADNAYDEGFGHVLTRSRLDRGELTLYATRRLSAWPLVRLSIRMALGRWTDDVDLETHPREGADGDEPQATAQGDERRRDAPHRTAAEI